MSQTLYLLCDIGCQPSEREIRKDKYDFRALGKKWNLINKRRFKLYVRVSFQRFFKCKSSWIHV